MDMKRFFGNVLKFIVVLSVIATVAYMVIRYWDKIITLVGRVKSMVTGKCRSLTEADDYEDWSE